MGLFDWLRPKRARVPEDPMLAFDRRIDALTARAGALRRSAATLLTVRRELDRKLEGLGRHAQAAQDSEAQAREGGDADTAAVLHADQQRFAGEQAHVREQREKVVVDAAALTDAVQGIEKELETLRRERDSARVQLAARDMLASTRPALEERIDELLHLDAARDEIERAHALAEIYQEDAKARGER